MTNQERAYIMNQVENASVEPSDGRCWKML